MIYQSTQRRARSEPHVAIERVQVDLIVIGADSFTIQGEPVRDRERLIWPLDLRSSA